MSMLRRPQQLLRTAAVVLGIVLAILLLVKVTTPPDRRSTALAVQDRMLSAENPTEEQLADWSERFTRQMDELSEEERQRVHAARRNQERRRQVDRLRQFFALGPVERNAWLDAEVAARRENDAETAREQREFAGSNVPTPFPAGWNSPPDPAQRDANARRVLDLLSAEERALIVEYERLVADRLRSKR